MTESNTPSDLGPNSPKGIPIRDHKMGRTIIMGPPISQREKTLHIMRKVRKKRPPIDKGW